MTEEQFDDIAGQVRGYLKDYADSSLRKSGGRDQYDCPFCPSGTGKNGTGAFTVHTDTDKFHCYSCGEHGDILDLIGQVEGIADRGKQALRAAEIYGISIEDEVPRAKPKHAQPPKKRHEPKAEEPEPDFTEFLEEARLHLDDPACLAYLKKRGISLETAYDLGWGFCAEWRHPKSPNMPASPRLIIPTSDRSYSARDIRDGVKDYRKAGKQRIMNLERALFQIMDPLPEAKPAYIVEGEIDAASIIEVGGEAAALGSAANVDRLFEELGDRKPRATLVLSLDTDEAGRRKEDELAARLEEKGIPFYRWNVAEKRDGTFYKDPNEALAAGRGAFWQRVHDGMAMEQYKLKQWKERQEARMAEQKTETAASKKTGKRTLEELRNDCDVSRYLEDGRFDDDCDNGTDSIPTGFAELDKYLEGGLIDCLYVFGGVPSVGKTAFVLQIMDNIAKAENAKARPEHDILYFSLEMRRKELVARSISRYSLEKSVELYGNSDYAAFATDILKGKKYKSRWNELEYAERQKELLRTARAEYKEAVRGRLFIYPCKHYTVQEIYSLVKEYADAVKAAGEARTPIVFVDHMQAIDPPEGYFISSKELLDDAIKTLKDIANEFNAPVVAISILNRANYEQKSMAAFKESGMIEYVADGAWLMGEDSEGRRGEGACEVRKVELTLLKNRQGGKDGSLFMDYQPAFQQFRESGTFKSNGTGGGLKLKPRHR